MLRKFLTVTSEILILRSFLRSQNFLDVGGDFVVDSDGVEVGAAAVDLFVFNVAPLVSVVIALGFSD